MQMHILQKDLAPETHYMGNCQNYGPFLGPYYNTGPSTGPTLGDPKRDHNFDSSSHQLSHRTLKRKRCQCLEQQVGNATKLLNLVTAETYALEFRLESRNLAENIRGLGLRT